MPKKKNTGSPAPAAASPSPSQLAAGVEIIGGTPAGSSAPAAPAAKVLPLGDVTGIGIFGERERNRLVSIAGEIASLQTRSRELLERIPGELHRLFETVGEPNGSLSDTPDVPKTLAEIDAMPGETFAHKVAAFAVRGRAASKMRAAQAEFESMRGLAGVPEAEPLAPAEIVIQRPAPGEGLQPVGDDVLPD